MGIWLWLWLWALALGFDGCWVGAEFGIFLSIVGWAGVREFGGVEGFEG